MRKQIFLGAIASLLMASCSNELDVPVNQVLGGGNETLLSINVVANPITKALVTGSNFTGSAQIGVKLVDNGGTSYDNHTYNNIYYSTTDGTSWKIDPSKSILLSATPGTAYAYYPYTDNASLDFTAIPISSAANPDEQTDYMYGSVASGLKNSNPTASFTMNHAMSIVNFEIARGNYTGTGAITSVKMKGNTASNTGTMNAVAGTVTATAPGYEFESTTSLSLGSATGKFIVVPSGTSSALDFKVVMDGQTYTASTTAPVQLENGQVYKYTLTMSSTGLTINTVTVTAWGSEQDKGSLDTELDLSMTWEQAKATDGVYAIDKKGNAVAYASAISAPTGTYKGVAFVIKGKAYQVAKVNATGHDEATTVYWHKTGYSDISGLANFTNADGTNSTGYLAGTSSPQLSRDPATWIAGALYDFNGQTNTVTILAAQGDGTVDETVGKAVMDFRSGSNNEGYTDWFLPSCGELAYMFLKQTELNTLLGMVRGSAFTSSGYCSSSESGSGNDWCVNFSTGYVYGGYKGYSFYVRLVRAI